MGKQTIIVETKIDDVVIAQPEVSYRDATKLQALQSFAHAGHFSGQNTLTIKIKNHLKHQLITEIYGLGIHSFHEQVREFDLLTTLPHVVYSHSVPEINDENTYYVDTPKGIKEDFGDVSGLAKIRCSLKAEKKKRYYVAEGIKDCLFLTVFNSTTKASLNTHVNYSHFADSDARDYETFRQMLQLSLQRIRGSGDNTALHITIISSYLGTGVKAIYDMIDSMGYIHGAYVHLDFNGATSGGSVPGDYVIRTVGPVDFSGKITRALVESCEGDTRHALIAQTRPVVNYCDLSVMFKAGGIKLEKSIAFDAETGEHFRLG